jgi:RsiW-degrading membrane proteinase PrsW (M82 family)
VTLQFNNPPGWPVAPPNWYPDHDWRPDPAWPPAPVGWNFWTEAATPPPAPLVVVPAPASPRVTHSRWWARLAWIPTLIFGIVAYLVAMQVMIATQNPILFPTMLFIGAITVPASVLMLVYGLGHRVGHDGVLVVATAVVGGIIGVISAGQLESSLVSAGPGTGTVATYLPVAVIEESVKMLVPLAIFLFLRRRSPSLGVVLGIAAGAGFAVLETMGYGFTMLLTSQGDVSVVDHTLMLRALLAPASHVAWTGVVAAALWRMGDPSRKFRWSLLIGAFVAAIALHTTWDATSSPEVQLGVAVISLSVLVVAVVTGVRTPRQRPPIEPPNLMIVPVTGTQPSAQPGMGADASAGPIPPRLAG